MRALCKLSLWALLRSIAPQEQKTSAEKCICFGHFLHPKTIIFLGQKRHQFFCKKSIIFWTNSHYFFTNSHYFFGPKITNFSIKKPCFFITKPHHIFIGNFIIIEFFSAHSNSQAGWPSCPLQKICCIAHSSLRSHMLLRRPHKLSLPSAHMPPCPPIFNHPVSGCGGKLWK